MPGPIAKDQDELEAALLSPDLGADNTPAERKRAELVAQLAPHDDGHASQRVLDLVAADLGL